MTPAPGLAAAPAGPGIAASPARSGIAASPAVAMVAATFLFASMGVCVKLASAGHSAGEVVFWRGLVGASVIGLAARANRVSLATRVPATHFWRALTGVVAMFMWYYALGRLPLATAMTLNAMSSVWLALFLLGGAAMLGAARVDARLVGTVLAGFAGVAAILRPTIEHDQLWHGLIGLLSGMISATAYLQVAALARSGEPELRIVFWFSVGSAVFGAFGAALFGGFHAPTPVSAAELLGVGLLAATAQWLMTRAYGTGRTLVVASLQYLGIAFAFGWGVLLFDDRVTPLAVAGMVLIVGAGLAATRLRARGDGAGPVAEASVAEP